VSRNYAPAISLCAPYAGVSEWPGEGTAFKRPAHFHSDAHHSDVPKALDPFLAGIEAGDADQTASMRVQIILLGVNRAVWAREHERIVHEAVELRHVAGELRLAERCLARA
jgi:hypothetical protein